MKLRKDGKILLENVELAESVWKKTKGLMFRKELPKDSGMLFVFNEEHRPGFWMFGMRFPIDIIYLDKDMRVVEVKHKVKPMGLSPKTWRILYPKKPVKYVLETVAGFSKDNELEKEDVISF